MRPIAYMGALKHVESPWLCPQLIFPTLNGLLFRSIPWLRKCVYKIWSSVRTFTRSWDNSDWSFGWGL